MEGLLNCTATLYFPVNRGKRLVHTLAHSCPRTPASLPALVRVLAKQRAPQNCALCISKT